MKNNKHTSFFYGVLGGIVGVLIVEFIEIGVAVL